MTTVSIGDAFITIRPDTNNFARQAESELSGPMSGLGSFVKRGILAVGVAGAAALAAGTGIGVMFASDLESARIGFKNMMGSAELAQAHLEELKAFAAGSPFEFPDVVAGSQRLQGMGIEAGKVIPLMTSVGNAVAAMGGGADEIDGVTRALGQMNAKGKVSSEEMLQLAERGIPAWQMLADSMGKSVPEVQKLVSEGKVAAEVFLTAFNEEVPKRFGNAMAEQSQTFKGLVSTLKDTVQMGLGDMMQPVLANLTAQMPAITNMVSGLMTTVGPVLGDLATLIVDALGAILPALAPLLAVLGALLVSVVKPLIPVVEQLTPIIAQVAEILGVALNGALDKILPPLGDLLLAFTPLLPVLAQLISSVLSALAPVLAAIATALTPVVEALVAGFLPVIEELTPLLPQLTAAFLPLIPPLGQLLTALVPLIPLFSTLSTELLLKLLPVLIPIIQAVAEFAAQLIEKLVPVVESVVGWITEFVDALTSLDFSKASEMLDELWATVQDGISTFLSNLPGWLATGATKAVQWIKDAVPKALVELGKLWWQVETFIWGSLAKLPGILWNGALALAQWIWDSLPGALLALGELWVQVQAWVWSLIAQLPGWLLSAAEALWTWIADALPQVWTKLAEVLAFVAGFAIGLAIQLPIWLLQAAQALSQWIVDAAPQVVAWLGNILGSIVGWLIALPGRILAFAATIGAAILRWVVDAAQQLPGKLEEFARGLWDFLTGLPQRVKDMLIGAAEWLLDIGGDILQGLIDGITNATGALGDLAGTIKDKLIDGLKSVFEIWSPSRVMRDLGNHIGDGFRLGVEESMPKEIPVPAVPQPDPWNLDAAATGAGIGAAAMRSGQGGLHFYGPVTFGSDMQTAVTELDWFERYGRRSGMGAAA